VLKSLSPLNGFFTEQLHGWVRERLTGFRFPSFTSPMKRQPWKQTTSCLIVPVGCHEPFHGAWRERRGVPFFPRTPSCNEEKTFGPPYQPSVTVKLFGKKL
jgi:hypothetical protein